MKKIKQLLLFSFLPYFVIMLSCPAIVFSAADDGTTKMKVAVVDFDVHGKFKEHDVGSLMAEKMLRESKKLAVFQLRAFVLPRESLGKKQLRDNGLKGKEQISENFGKVYGVQAIITGTVLKRHNLQKNWQDTVSVAARLVDVSTGEILRAARVESVAMRDISSRISDLAMVIAGKKQNSQIQFPHKGKLSNSAVKSGHKKGEIWHEPFSNMAFVWVEGGCFDMGQSEREGSALAGEVGSVAYQKKYGDEFPLHRVCIDGFWLGKYEVTNEQFRLYAPNHTSRSYEGVTLDRDKQPVVYVGWDDAKDFASWITTKNGGGSSFRLPTESEWEYACRAQTLSARFWGEDSDEAGEYANVYDRVAEKLFQWQWPHHDCDDGYAVTSPVGQFYSNDFQLYDMLGNVWEWTEDSYADHAYRHHQPKNPLHTGSGNKVRRGGSWGSSPGSVRCANRGNRSADRKNKETGFRLVRIEK